MFNILQDSFTIKNEWTKWNALDAIGFQKAPQAISDHRIHYENNATFIMKDPEPANGER